jgi:hypothetical protein
MAAAIYELYPRTKGLVIGIGMLFGFGVLILAANKTETFWQLKDAAMTSPPPTPVTLEQPGFQEKSGTAEFSLGGFTVGRPILDLKKPFRPFLFAGFSPVTMYLRGDDLLVDFTTWNGPGEPPIEVKGSEFEVLPEGWDKNSNSNALEVVNTKDAPIFQLIRKSPTHIVVNGLFLFPSGLLLVANSPSTWTNPDPNAIASLLPKAIFKYPAWKFPGKYADNSN